MSLSYSQRTRSPEHVSDSVGPLGATAEGSQREARLGPQALGCQAGCGCHAVAASGPDQLPPREACPCLKGAWDSLSSFNGCPLPHCPLSLLCPLPSPGMRGCAVALRAQLRPFPVSGAARGVHPVVAGVDVWCCGSLCVVRAVLSGVCRTPRTSGMSAESESTSVFPSVINLSFQGVSCVRAGSVQFD